jgi:hypothetical protein
MLLKRQPRPWPDGRRIVVNPASEKGDVVAEIDGIVLLATTTFVQTSPAGSAAASASGPNRRPTATLLQLAQRARHVAPET